MKIKLSFKLFAAFFLILTIVVGAMFLWRALFFRNFRAYIHQEELKRLEALVPELEEAYRAHGSWDGIAADEADWRARLDIGTRFLKSIPPRPGEGDGRDTEPRVLLTDAANQPVIGIPGSGDQPRLVPVAVDGETVGWLGLRKREPFKSGPPAVLVKLHTQQLYIIGGAVIVLTAFIAFLFSRHLLNPIQRLARGTRALAERNFEVRIRPTTRDELGQLAMNFNAMAQTFENYEKMRRQWLTDISHELRTPLAVLRGEIEALQDGIRNPDRRNLASLHAEILRISKLVEDLHLLSMADSDRLHFRRQWIAPRAILEKALASFGTRLERHRITVALALEGREDVRIRGDADRLEQVFTNILENTCRYVPSPARLNISLRSDETFVYLLFEDSGSGVPPEALPRLFDRLYRVDSSRNRDSGGSGLGLSICRHIVENHKGRIWAGNSSMGGLTIGIKLPLDHNGN
jgi:two-component system sensor histidine kinase BaeS